MGEIPVIARFVWRGGEEHRAVLDNRWTRRVKITVNRLGLAPLLGEPEATVVGRPHDAKVKIVCVPWRASHTFPVRPLLSGLSRVVEVGRVRCESPAA